MDWKLRNPSSCDILHMTVSALLWGHLLFERQQREIETFGEGPPLRFNNLIDVWTGWRILYPPKRLTKNLKMMVWMLCLFQRVIFELFSGSMCQLEVDLLAQQNGRAGADLYLSYKVEIFYPKQQTKSKIFSKIICLTFSQISWLKFLGWLDRLFDLIDRMKLYEIVW